MKLLPSMLSALALAALGAFGESAKLPALGLAALSAFGESAKLPAEAGYGAKPELPAPN